MNRTRQLQPEAGVIGHLPLLGLGCRDGLGSGCCRAGPDADVLDRSGPRAFQQGQCPFPPLLDLVLNAWQRQIDHHVFVVGQLCVVGQMRGQIAFARYADCRRYAAVAPICRCFALIDECGAVPTRGPLAFAPLRRAGHVGVAI